MLNMQYHAKCPIHDRGPIFIGLLKVILYDTPQPLKTIIQPKCYAVRNNNDDLGKQCNVIAYQKFNHGGFYLWK